MDQQQFRVQWLQTTSVDRGKKKMTGKWAIVTGASSGIGAATAEALGIAGYNLILVARRLDRLEKISRAILNLVSSPIDVLTFRLDMRSSVEIDEFFERFDAEKLGSIDVLVNNAGLAKGVQRFQDALPDDWDAMIDTNVKGLLRFTRHLLPHMIANGSGHIVNIGSAAGRWVYPGGSVYCASKFAVRAISEGLRMDLIGTGLRVTNVEPGMVNTEFSLVRLGDPALADKVYDGMEPLSAKDVAETIAWCISRPPRVNIQEIVMFPTDQAAVGQVARKG